MQPVGLWKCLNSTWLGLALSFVSSISALSATFRLSPPPSRFSPSWSFFRFHSSCWQVDEYFNCIEFNFSNTGAYGGLYTRLSQLSWHLQKHPTHSSRRFQHDLTVARPCYVTETEYSPRFHEIPWVSICWIDAFPWSSNTSSLSLSLAPSLPPLFLLFLKNLIMAPPTLQLGLRKLQEWLNNNRWRHRRGRRE